MDFEFMTHSAEETKEAGAMLAALVSAGDVIPLAGDLGAGKTCFVQGFARGLGIQEPVTSPTFNLLLVHQGRLPLYHFDLYRLARPDELEDIGFYELIGADGVAVIEWGDRFPQALPADRLMLRFFRAAEAVRRIEVAAHGARSVELALAWRAAMRKQGVR